MYTQLLNGVSHGTRRNQRNSIPCLYKQVRSQQLGRQKPVFPEAIGRFGLWPDLEQDGYRTLAKEEPPPAGIVHGIESKSEGWPELHP